MQDHEKNDALKGIIEQKKEQSIMFHRKAVNGRDDMLDNVRIPPPNTGNKALDVVASSMIRNGIPMLLEYLAGLGEAKYLSKATASAIGFTKMLTEFKNDEIENRYDKRETKDKARKNAAKSVVKSVAGEMLLDNAKSVFFGK